MALDGDGVDQVTELGEDVPPRAALVKGDSCASNIDRKDVNATILYGAVIHFTTTAISPNVLRPWKQTDPVTFYGTGFCLGDKQIITNCHNIQDSASIRLERHGKPGNFEGRVLCQSRLSDLALLTVDDESFWDGLPSVNLQDDVPALDDTVVCVGYPLGAKSVTVTRGVVSNVSLADLSLRGTNPQQLRVQIDAAINPGNSGGPVFNTKTGEVVGVAFAGRALAQNIGFIIPVPVIRLFLAMYRKERHPQCGLLPKLGIGTESLENPSMRKSCFGGELPTHRNGCLITSIDKFSSAVGKLQIDDILLEVDSQVVSEKGEIVFRGEERLDFRYLITKKLVGDIVRIKVFREVGEPPDGIGKKTMQEITLEITLAALPRLAGSIEGLDYFSTYIIIGGLVVIPAGDPVREACERYFKHPASQPEFKAVEKANKREMHETDDECCILASVLAHSLNVTYDRYRGQIVNKVNGTEIKNMRHLAKLVHEISSEELVIDFDVRKEKDMRSRVVFDVSAMKRHEAEILKKSKIADWCSPELLRE